MEEQSLYAVLLGDAFARLSPLLRSIHDARPSKRLEGRCEIRGGNVLARLAARMARLPRPQADVPVTVFIERIAGGERWSRRFGTRPLRSVLRNRQGLLEEALGLAAIAFELSAGPEHIRWRFRGARLTGTPLPLGWLLDCEATESMADGRYCFDVSASLRGLGLLVHYRGWLAETGAERGV